MQRISKPINTMIRLLKLLLLMLQKMANQKVIANTQEESLKELKSIIFGFNFLKNMLKNWKNVVQFDKFSLLKKEKEKSKSLGKG